MELSLNKNDFINNLTKAFNFVSYQKTRHYLNGVLFEITNNKIIRLVATDGHKACVIGDTENIINVVHSAKEKPIERINSEHQFIVSNDMVDKILKNFKLSNNIDDKVTITILADKHLNAIEVSDGSISIKGNIIDGNFPDYVRIIPQFLDKPNAIFSSNLLISLFKKAKKNKHNPYRFFITGEKTPSVITNENMTELFVLMTAKF